MSKLVQSKTETSALRWDPLKAQRHEMLHSLWDMGVVKGHQMVNLWVMAHRGWSSLKVSPDLDSYAAEAAMESQQMSDGLDICPLGQHTFCSLDADAFLVYGDLLFLAPIYFRLCVSVPHVLVSSSRLHLQGLRIRRLQVWIRL